MNYNVFTTEPLTARFWSTVLLCAAITFVSPDPSNPQSSAAGKLTSFLVNLNNLSGVLDGTGDLPEGTLRKLDKQLADFKAEGYAGIDYENSEYAVSLGANFGIGEGFEVELREKITLINERTKEFDQLTGRNLELARVENLFEHADLALSDGKNVLQDYLESEKGAAADQAAGNPVFNNWQVIEDELEPRFSERLSEVRRIRKELVNRTEQLGTHLKKASGVLNYYNNVLERAEHASNLPKSEEESTRILNRIKKRRFEVQKASDDIVKANKRTRQRVKKILEDQARAAARNKLINDVLSVVKIGLAGYGIAADGSTSDSTGNNTTTVNIDIRSTTINITPFDPGNGVPIGRPEP